MRDPKFDLRRPRGVWYQLGTHWTFDTESGSHAKVEPSGDEFIAYAWHRSEHKLTFKTVEEAKGWVEQTLLGLARRLSELLPE